MMLHVSSPHRLHKVLLRRIGGATEKLALLWYLKDAVAFLFATLMFSTRVSVCGQRLHPAPLLERKKNRI